MREEGGSRWDTGSDLLTLPAGPGVRLQCWRRRRRRRTGKEGRMGGVLHANLERP